MAQLKTLQATPKIDMEPPARPNYLRVAESVRGSKNSDFIACTLTSLIKESVKQPN